MEYDKFAKYYDIFYKNKNYKKEVDFLINFLNKTDNIIDIGCGTGVHASILINNGFNVDGVDLNKEMLEICKNRVNTNLYLQNMLDLNIPKKYDVIISMFAVINHLKDTKELTKCFTNFKNILNKGGKVIIDLHNPQNSGIKTDTFDKISRTMEWNYDKKLRIEKSKITFKINGKEYTDYHTFRIFSIDEVKKCASEAKLTFKKVYENYDINKEGNNESKNLQFLLVSE